MGNLRQEIAQQSKSNPKAKGAIVGIIQPSFALQAISDSDAVWKIRGKDLDNRLLIKDIWKES
jgi:hypothetical protein